MRKSIYIDGFSHGNNPVPAACLHHNILMSGAIFGTDKTTGKIPESIEQQCQLMFENTRRILEKAGGNWKDVIKMTFYLRPEVSRALLNQYWVDIFSDETSRPARHVIVSNTLPASMDMQCNLFAIMAPHN